MVTDPVYTPGEKTGPGVADMNKVAGVTRLAVVIPSQEPPEVVFAVAVNAAGVPVLVTETGIIDGAGPPIR